MTPRETIYAALFTLAVTATGVKSSSRRLKHWTDVSPADQPALFMVQRTETAKVVTRLPELWTLHVDFVIYATDGGQLDRSPMTQLNPIVDALVNALMPPNVPYEQTLGGLVERCRIDGTIQTDEGQLGNQALVVVPVVIFAPQ